MTNDHIGDRGELRQVSENTVTSVMEVLQRIDSLYPFRYAGAEESKNDGVQRGRDARETQGRQQETGR